MDSPVPVGNLLKFLHICENLKRTKRTGWLYKKVPNPESISDHMHRMSILAMFVDDPQLNKDRCVKMAVVHDLAESVVGDITPLDGITKTEKSRREKEAMHHMCVDILGNSLQAQEIFGLWQEYEDAKTPEAKFVKDLDKFEMILQAFEYERAEGKDLEEFFVATQGKFTHPMVKSWVDGLHKERKLEISKNNTK